MIDGAARHHVRHVNRIELPCSYRRICHRTTSRSGSIRNIWSICRARTSTFSRRYFAAGSRSGGRAREAHLSTPARTSGCVCLPSGALVRCQPKVAVENIFYMLAVGAGFPLAVPGRAGLVRRTSTTSLISSSSTSPTLWTSALRAGSIEAMSSVRRTCTPSAGRIAIAEDIRRNHVLRHRTFAGSRNSHGMCQRTGSSGRQSMSCRKWSRGDELRRSWRARSSARRARSDADCRLSVFDRFTYHRLNDDYEPIHRFAGCSEGASVSEEFGEFGFRAFLLDMNSIIRGVCHRLVAGKWPYRLTRCIPQFQPVAG